MSSGLSQPGAWKVQIFNMKPLQTGVVEFKKHRHLPKSNKEMLLSCITGNVGSSIFGDWPMLVTKSQDISASTASILAIILKICLLGVPSMLRKCNTKIMK